ncbi:hypothetical protein KUH32_01295 [Thalassococcus sp. CAU 1522]|uniref:DUF3618 domain-containing protein n=1 Tax=Thalassococcus arenae TaxID=2851652 RepID=A0ABS6N306_9RHOB|nr:hypothetical protein [Thalassococcus arenae]MBV2358396.1 hypothetical protein [Thalassococcus arenae]
MAISSDLSDTVRRHAQELAADAKAQVSKKAEREIDKAQQRTAREIRQAAKAADAAGDAFDSGSLQAEAARRIAHSLEGIAQQVRQADLGQTAHTVSTFARRHPGLFIGAAAFAGFAAMRFLKASGPAPDAPETEHDPWAATRRQSPAGADAVPHPDRETLRQSLHDPDHHGRPAEESGGIYRD